MSKKIKNTLSLKNLFICLLIIIIYFNYKGILQNLFFLSKNNNFTNIITKYPEDLEFFNKVINKYFKQDDFSSPTFYFSPHELGIHILGEGYRLNNYRVKKK